MAKANNFDELDDENTDLNVETDLDDDDYAPDPDIDEEDNFNKFFNVDKLEEFSESTLAKVSQGGGSSKVSMSLVFSSCGKRMKLTNALFAKLNEPEALSFKPKEGKLYIASEFPNAKKYEFSPHDESHIIYKAEIIHLIVEHFSLNYQNPKRTSICFDNISFTKYKNEENKIIPVAIIDMTKY